MSDTQQFLKAKFFFLSLVDEQVSFYSFSQTIKAIFDK
jgi:hypothetical protein